MVLHASETRTKIVCTIGPTSRDEAILRRLICAGMDVARINFSHGTREEHVETIERIRQVSSDEGATIAVMADLQGPKLRLGVWADPVDLEPGDRIVLTTEPADGTGNVFPLPHPELMHGVAEGGHLLFDDGAVEAVVLETAPTRLAAEVCVGGRLSSRKGVAAPGGTSSLAAMTAKDRADARFAAECGVDFMALSFVQRAADLADLRALLNESPGGDDIAIVAKIEKREALDHLDEILRMADGVMVARGDLGVEVSAQEVPFLQKEIIAKCNRWGIPVITATQMLQSMIDHPRPTRAEASDVANAILDGTDAVMLSAETAAGRYPVEAVEMMREISEITERQMTSRVDDVPFDDMDHDHPITDAISDATVRIADAVGARLIVTSTSSGYTARQIARERPRQPIVAMTPDAAVERQLALVWGVVPHRVSAYEGTDAMFTVASATLLERAYASAGDLVVITGSIPTATGGKTNFVKVHRL